MSLILGDVNRLDTQEHQGIVTRTKAKLLKSHKDQIEQEKFQGLKYVETNNSQKVAKVEIMKPSMIEEFPKVNELPQARIEVEEIVVLNVKEEISNVEHCGLMRDKNIDKDSVEIEKKDRVE
ncbi:hypothetical protein M9H77_02401 [Catharanthus roseus]|uniref:Uncharacterized protein n=1 Tax=Catharanthus roseus TaxID=4058 RepID=A0ACC0C8E6_CATRO|nr:hypothetical protein M9H77_02401 [Catharanthus roseus]